MDTWIDVDFITQRGKSVFVSAEIDEFVHIHFMYTVNQFPSKKSRQSSSMKRKKATLKLTFFLSRRKVFKDYTF